MFKLIKNLIKNIKYKIYSFGSITAEEFLNSLDGGNLKKRGGRIMQGCRDKMSRREAAIALGINPNELKAIEKGLKQPSKTLAVKMHKVYKVSLRTLWKYAA